MPRRKLDFYETPSMMADYMMRQWGNIIKDSEDYGRVFEPCVGDHMLSMVLNERLKIKNIITNDIDHDKIAKNHFDMTKPEIWDAFYESTEIGLVITNPPFSVAFEILENAYRVSNFGVLLLLRLSFLEPTQKRGAWLKEHPPNRIMIFGQPRPSFTNEGNDSVTTAWFFWSKVYTTYYAPEFAMNWQ